MISAGMKRHNDAPKKDDSLLVGQAYLSWMQALGSSKDSALSPEPESEPVERADAEPDGSADHDEIFATLLRVIEGTEIARHLGSAPPLGNIQSDAVAVAEPAVPEEFAPDFTLPFQAPLDAVPTERESPAVEPPFPPLPDSTPASDEFLAALLSTIQHTEMASRLRPEVPIECEDPVAPAPTEPEEIASSISALTLPVQVHPSSELTEPEPPIIEPPPATPSEKAPEPIEPIPVAFAPPTPVPPQLVEAAERAQRLISSSRRRSSKSWLLRAPILVMLSAEIVRFCEKLGVATDYLDRAELRLERWFQGWLVPDPRHSLRIVNPPLVAYHWIVDTPQALEIADISSGGLHLLTSERWSHGNILSMTLQRTDKAKGSPDSWIAVDFVVIRWCKDGLAGAFIPSWPGLSYVEEGRAGNCADKKTLEHFVKQLHQTTN